MRQKAEQVQTSWAAWDRSILAGLRDRQRPARLMPVSKRENRQTREGADQTQQANVKHGEELRISSEGGKGAPGGIGAVA